MEEFYKGLVNKFFPPFIVASANFLIAFYLVSFDFWFLYVLVVRTLSDFKYCVSFFPNII